jgi:hypothetical protein
MKTKNIFLSATILFMTFLCSSCIFDFNVITGKGNVVTETRSAKDFTAIELKTGANMEIVKGNIFNVSVTDYENLVKYLSVEVVDCHLIIKKDPKSVHIWNSKAKVVVTMPDPLYSLQLSGSGNLNVLSAFHDLQLLLLSGSGNIGLRSDCQLNKLEANISGSGNINATGNLTVQNLSTRISGSGNIHLSQMKAKDADCSISGSGKMYLFIVDNLDAHISGSGNIIYSGTPKVNSHISGSGNVYKN